MYEKLSLFFEVIAYSDNDQSLWGGRRNNTTIIPPSELPELIKNTGATIVIATDRYYMEIAEQLDGLGLTYYICSSWDNSCYELKDGVRYPVSFGCPAAYVKSDKESFCVLFVQEKPCARTDKIAETLKNKGILTYSAYTMATSNAGKQAYEKEFPFWGYGDLLDFVNQSEFDIIHCSNSPDILVNILLHSNKKIIHDCHDIVTLEKKEVHPAEIAQEFLANTLAGGMIYTTELARAIMVGKYGVKEEKTLVLGNYPVSTYREIVPLPKLSAADGAIHCVYEGSLISAEVAAKELQYRFFEPLFVRLAELGVHVHIYSHSDPKYLKGLDRAYENIHYEGNCSGRDLVEKMTQFDLGLAWFCSVDSNYVELASVNKVYEYLMAGLPVVTNIKSIAQVVKEHHCGGTLDLEHDDVVAKLQSYQEISIPMDFCDMHGFTMDANAERILEFYKKVCKD